MEITTTFNIGDTIIRKTSFHNGTKPTREIVGIEIDRHGHIQYRATLIAGGTKGTTDLLKDSQHYFESNYELAPAEPDVVYTITLKQHGHTSNQNVTAPEIAFEAAQRLIDSLPKWNDANSPSVEWSLDIVNNNGGRGLSPSQPNSGTVK
jgi:hypothetical protein